MRSHRIVRLLSLTAVFAVVAGGFAVPAQAAKKPKCPAFTPAEPETASAEGAEALEAPIAKVTDKHTADAPLVVEYEHGPALWETATQTPIQEDTVFFNFQVVTKQPAVGLHVRQEWASPSPDDMDLYLYDATGAQVALSGAINAVPVDQSSLGFGYGGNGFEYIPGYGTASCSGYTAESRAFLTAGQAMTLKVWLGEVGSDIPG